MNCIKSLIYPENTSVRCPYTIDEIAAKNAQPLDFSYAVLPRDGSRPLSAHKWFVRGAPNRVLDAIANILATPGKVLLWNSQFHSNYVSPETEAILKQYMKDNRLQHVKVRINQYAPLDELKRFITNPRTSTITKICLLPIGIILSFLPVRLIGSDCYSSLTNTIHIVSNDPVIALHEAGHAKDFASRKYPGLYTVARYIPFVELYQEAKASNDAIAYLKAKNYTKLVPQAYALLAPAYATYVAKTVLTIMNLFLKMPFGFMSNVAPRIDKAVTWLTDPVIRISHPVLLRFAFVLEKFPPFLSRITTISVGLGHVVGRVAGHLFTRQQAVAAAAA